MLGFTEEAKNALATIEQGRKKERTAEEKRIANAPQELKALARKNAERLHHKTPKCFRTSIEDLFRIELLDLLHKPRERSLGDKRPVARAQAWFSEPKRMGGLLGSLLSQKT